MEMLSDDGDLFSDEDEPGTSYMSSDGSIRSPGDKILPSAADRRAHHNALERKRRDHIKDSFSSLRDSVPSLQGEKASRAQILKKAAEYIQFMRKKNNNVQSDIDNLARQNKMLEEQIRIMERQKGLLSGSSLSILSNGNGTTNGNVTGDSGVVISPTISYECSENSNESGASQSDLTTSAAAVLVNGLAHQNGLDNSSVTVTSTEPAMPPTLPAVTAAANPPAHVVINGTMRSAVMKNGATSTIIVQNPQQLKTTTNGQHDRIYVHTSGKSIHTSGHQATATPIIITTGHHTTGAVNTSTASGAAVTALPQARRSPSSAALPQIGTLPAGALPGTYLVQKAPGPGVTFPNGFRTVVVHGSSTASPTGVTTTNGTPTSNPLSLFGEKKTQGGTVASGTPTPNIHIVSTIPAGAAATYSGRPATKRFKISAELPGESNSNGTTSTSVTSVSS